MSASVHRDQLGYVVFSDNATVSFGAVGNTVTASAAGGGAGDGVNRLSAGTRLAPLTATILFQSSNGITFGLDAASTVMTASHNALTTQTNPGASGSNGSFSFQTLSFSNANGLSFGTSAGPAIFGSYTVPTVTNSSWTVSDAATSGTVARLAFTNANGVTLSLSTGAAGLHTIVGSHNALTSQSNQAASASNGSFTFQTVAFSNANNVTFGTSAGSIITASVAAPGGGAVVSNAIQDVSTATGSGTNTSRFAADDHVHRGIRGIIASGTATTFFGDFHLAAGANITLQTGGNSTSGVISISAAAPGGGAGATMSVYPYWPLGLATSTFANPSQGSTGGSFQQSYNLTIAPLAMPAALSFHTIEGNLSSATVAGTGSESHGYYLGIYTLNAGTALSLLTSYVFNHRMSQNSVTAQTHRFYWGTNSTSNSTGITGNSSASLTGIKRFLWNATGDSLAASQYWQAVAYTRYTTGAVVGGPPNFMNVSVSQSTVAANYIWTTGSASMYGPFHGVASTTTNVSASVVNTMPASIHTSAITVTGFGTRLGSAYVRFYRTG